MLSFLAFGQEDAPWRQMLESKRQVTEYLQRCARKLSDRAAAEMQNRESWDKVRAQRLDETRDMLGLLPWPERTPLNVRVTGVLDKGSYTIEKVAFESMPKVYVTGNLYMPKQRASRVPAIIYVCGHAYSPYGDKAQYQRHGISFAKNGYAAFILDSIQIAETFAIHHGIHNQEMFDWYSRGYTPAGVEVWNAIRAIDYLQTRPEIDRDRIGMTGRSGGAAMTWFTAAVDPRVKVAVPVMGISTYAANVQLNTQRLHCDCMFTINAHQHDMMHQGALIAPRPLLMMHGRKDALFPVPGYEEFERTTSSLYKSFGAAEAFGNIVVETGHEDSDYLRRQAIRFFDKHLLGLGERTLDMDYSNAPPEQLATFETPPADARNFRVHEIFTTRPPSPRFESVDQWQKRRAELTANLSKLFRDDSDDDVPLRFHVRKPSKSEGKAPALLYVASEGEDTAYINQMLAGLARLPGSVAMYVWPRGIGPVSWDKAFWKATLRNAMHTGQTVDSMRLRDVQRAFEQLRSLPGVDPDRIMVAGKGISGAIGMYAAILDPRVHQVLLMDAPSSHREGPIFLNVMRHTDLPEAAALLAPRRLNFYAHMPPAYEFTRHVYSLMGKPEHVFLSMHIEGLLAGRYNHAFASGL